MIIYLKEKASGSNKLQETLALCYLGVRDGSRSYQLEVARRGFDSPHVQPKIFPARGCSRTQGLSSDMSQGQGWKSAVILALSPRESKGQNDDVPQLQN